MVFDLMEKKLFHILVVDLPNPTQRNAINFGVDMSSSVHVDIHLILLQLKQDFV